MNLRADGMRPHASAPPPGPGWPARVRANLFDGWFNSILSLALIGVALYLLPQLLQWGWLKAEFRPDNAACRALQGEGACWGVVAEKYRVILLGRYPYAEHWRPLAATALLLLMLVLSCTRPLWGKWMIPAWAAVLALFFALMGGGVLGLEKVATSYWGGLPLTVMLATFGIAAAFPLAILIALGRSSDLPVIRMLCGGYVELVRGVPLVSVLFMASFLFPLFMPSGISIDALVRVMLGISLFAAAYLAEVVRAGVQAVPRAQKEAAAALGLGYWQIQSGIVLPQALRMVVPSIMNSFISTFKDTSLVVIVSLYELTGSLTLALSGDAQWRQFYLEAYLFIGIIYWVFCHAMSRYSRWIERELHRGMRRV